MANVPKMKKEKSLFDQKIGELVKLASNQIFNNQYVKAA